MPQIDQALIVEDSEGHAALAEVLLSDLGFNITWVPTVIEGITWLQSFLSDKHPPPLVLVDVKLPDYYHPRLEGTALATWLTDSILRGVLYPARIIGISDDVTPKREWEAMAAGCELILSKPLLPSTAAIILKFFQDTAPDLTNKFNNIAVQAFRQQQLDVLDLVIQAHQSSQAFQVWTSSEVRTMLGCLCSAIHLSNTEHKFGQQLMERLGGQARASTLLHQYTSRLGVQQVPVITKMMQGASQQSIAHTHGLTWKTLQPVLEKELVVLAASLSQGFGKELGKNSSH